MSEPLDIIDLFTRAMALTDAEERSAFLREECDGRPDVLTEVESLLAHADEDTIEETFGAVEVLGLEGDDAFDDGLPEAIGDYRVTGLLGAGGMGRVYEAVQANPERRVAVKVIHDGGLTREQRDRFLVEARLLGRLHHPSIAQVIEAGQWSHLGREQPFIAMELVEGATLEAHVAARQLEPRARLQLLRDLCHGVHHAHQRGVIHRDLKPANVLVDGAGQPKIIDFGIARPIDDDLERLRTRTGVLVGTLSYMSPEQMTGLDVSSQTDVYSLGVIGFELMSGVLPHDFEGASPSRILRIVCDEPARRLGTVVAGASRDLETILAKALEKGPDHRYASAQEMAEDLGRYLETRPILARRIGMGGRLVRWARRNPLLAATTALVFIVALVGAGAYYQESRRVQHNERLALSSYLKAEELCRHLVQDVFSELQKLERVPLLEASARRTLAFYEGLEPEFVARLDRSGHHQALYNLGQVFRLAGDHDKATDILRRVYDDLIGGPVPNDERSLKLLVEMTSALSNSLAHGGDFEESGRVMSDGVAHVSQALNETAPAWVHQGMATLYAGNAMLLARQSRFLEALQATDLCTHHFKRSGVPSLLHANLVMTSVRWRQLAKVPVEALEELKHAGAIVRGHLSHNPEDTAGLRMHANVLMRHAAALADVGRAVEGEPMRREAEGLLSRLVRRNPWHLHLQDDLVTFSLFNHDALQRAGRSEEGIPALERAIAAMRRAITQKPEVAYWRERLLHLGTETAFALLITERASEVASLARSILDDVGAHGITDGPPQSRVLACDLRSSWARALLETGAFAEAEPILRSVLSGLEAPKVVEAKWRSRRVRLGSAQVLLAQALIEGPRGDHDAVIAESRDLLRKALEIRRTMTPVERDFISRRVPYPSANRIRRDLRDLSE